MKNSVVRTLKRIGILSVAGAMALSASAMVSPSAFAASPYTNSSDLPQYQPGQQPQDNQYPNRKPQNGQTQNGQTQNGQTQNGQTQNGQAQNGQWQNGQWQNNQNGQAQNGQWQNGQWQNNQNGQAQNGQWQNGRWQNGRWQNNQNGQAQNGQWQNGQWQNGQWRNGQWHNNQNGQANTNTYARQRYDWSAYRPGYQPPQWQQYHRDFNPHSYQWNRTSNQRYYHQSYQRPDGWYDQRWAYGQILPRLFWSQDYWLTGYYNFGLIDPPYGYVWVQNGNDALLVDVQSGQILSVEYDVFYS
jgi:Ni/Co efflux regulator RcnB